MRSKLDGIALEALLADMPLALVVLDTSSGVVVYANEAASTLGFASQHAPDWAAFGIDGQRLSPEGTSSHRRILQLQRGDERRSLLFHCHRVGDELVVLTFDDVTAFDELQRQLREALQARDDLVSMAAHELRSPLGALQLVGDRLARKAGDIVPEELRKLAETMRRLTERLGVLVSNLLDVNRMRAGKFELELELCSLGDIIRDAAEPLAEQAHAEGIALEVDIREACIGMWDRSRMEQILVNLVTNALKYGSGTPIRVVLDRPSARECVLRVCDGGMGIPPDAHERIFEPFTRASGSHKAHSLGLGLFIVRNIARAHGGDVELESSPGTTIFTIRLAIR